VKHKLAFHELKPVFCIEEILLMEWRRSCVGFMYCIVPFCILHDFFHDVDALTCNLTSQPASKQTDYSLLLLTMSDLLK
jgi:hypothetical protein